MKIRTPRTNNARRRTNHETLPRYIVAAHVAEGLETDLEILRNAVRNAVLGVNPINWQDQFQRLEDLLPENEITMSDSEIEVHPVVRPDFVKCIRHTHADKKGRSWCGRRTSMEWVFQNIDHAAYTVAQEQRLQPCPDCLATVARILWPNANCPATDALARNQPCGCVICVCEDDHRCQGCDAHHCGKHPVGQIPSPVYEEGKR